MAIGFETTAPSTALTLLRAKRAVHNFSVFCNHVTIIPPCGPSSRPPTSISTASSAGHVVRRHRLPALRAHARRVRQTRGRGRLRAPGRAPGRLPGGAPTGRGPLPRWKTSTAGWSPGTATPRPSRSSPPPWRPRPHFEWRGLGSIPWSALNLRPEFAGFDAEKRFDVPGVRVADPRACQCGEVLRGACARGNAGCSGRRARPRNRSARAWSPARERAPLITISVA